MTRAWPFRVVSDVRASSGWYCSLLGCTSAMEADHPHRGTFDMLVETDGNVLLCLMSWANHELPWSPAEGAVGIGCSLYFVIEDFDAAWERAQALGATIDHEPRLQGEGFRTREFTLRDPDGYRATIGDGTKGWLSTRRA